MDPMAQFKSNEFDSNFLYSSDINWIYVDAESNVWPNILLYFVHCGGRFHFGRTDCIHIDVVFHESIFT